MDNNIGFCMFLSNALQSERNNNIRSGVYGFTQRLMGYNSSRIEGNSLTEAQTELLFEGTVAASSEDYKSNDIEEMVGHFSMFNAVVDSLKYPISKLSQDLIKFLHFRLKSGVFRDVSNGYAIGEYKNRPNIVGNHKTVSPKDVSKEMDSLLLWYSSQEKSLTTMVEFHLRYESIHPFQDGNGRTGRALLFRECVAHSISPIIIRDINKSKYYDGFKEYNENGSISLMNNLFEEEQEFFYKEASYFM